MTIRVGPYSFRCGPARLHEFRPSQLHAASLGALKSVPRSRRDHRALLLRQGCEQMQDEGVNSRRLFAAADQVGTNSALRPD